MTLLRLKDWRLEKRALRPPVKIGSDAKKGDTHLGTAPVSAAKKVVAIAEREEGCRECFPIATWRGVFTA